MTHRAIDSPDSQNRYQRRIGLTLRLRQMPKLARRVDCAPEIGRPRVSVTFGRQFAAMMQVSEFFANCGSTSADQFSMKSSSLARGGADNHGRLT